jgi:hypothetical protein
VEQNETSLPEKRDYIAEIFALCSTLSDEALFSAEAKGRANGFDLDRGDITYREIQINFVSGRDIIENAIRDEKLIQLPITVQKRLLSNLEAISKALQGFMSDTDQTVNLDAAVESLNASIWQYGLNHLSDQILGYQKKLNQLKQQEVKIAGLIALLERGQPSAEAIAVLREEAQSSKDAIEAAKKDVDENTAAVLVARTKSEEDAELISARSTATQNSERDASEAASALRASLATVSPLEADIKSFFQEIENYRKTMEQSNEEAAKFLTSSEAKLASNLAEHAQEISRELATLSETTTTAGEKHSEDLVAQLGSNKLEIEEMVAAFNKSEALRLKAAKAESDEMLEAETTKHKELVETVGTRIAELETELTKKTDDSLTRSREAVAEHVKELEELKERVKEQVAHATGVGQFGAFNARQKSISKDKYLWVGAITVLVIVVVGLTYMIALHAGQGDLHSAAFWIKLSMNVPLGFLISFCTIQYNRERRLEEEYAFKASISVSLTPYRDLIYQILEKDDAIKDGSYTTFVIDSVRNIFSSPTEKIFDSPKRFEGVSEKSLKAAAELIGTAVKAAK